MIIKTAEELRHDCKILDSICEATNELGNVGNNNIKKATALAYASTRINTQHGALSLVVGGLSGDGKTHTIKTSLELMPDDVILRLSHMTPKYLHHYDGGSLDRKMILAEELAVIEGDGAKLGISENEIAIGTVENIEGSHRSVTKRVSAVNLSVVTTTNQTRGNSEFRNRCVELYIDNSKEHIRAVRLAMLTTKPSINRVQIINNFREFFKFLRILPVEVRYASGLFEHLPELPYEFRDIKKILVMIMSHTILRQADREEVNGFLLATTEDYLAIREIAESFLNPPSPERLELIESLPRPFGWSDIKTHFGLSRSGAFYRLNSLKKSKTIVEVENGKYDINFIKLPEIISLTCPMSPTSPHDFEYRVYHLIN